MSPDAETQITSSGEIDLGKIYPACRSAVHAKIWGRITQACGQDSRPDSFLKGIARLKGDPELPGFLSELARLEWALYQASRGKIAAEEKIEKVGVNPTLQLLQVSWRYLPSFLNGDRSESTIPKDTGGEFVLVWQDPKTGRAVTKTASNEDLLVLKLVVEGIDFKAAAAQGDLPVGAIDSALHRAVSRGIILSPRSLIRRDTSGYSAEQIAEEPFVCSNVFTLQWHITQQCDLHCKHCYDRSDRSDFGLDRGIELLDDLRTFCGERHVRGQVTFTGGNPLLHPQFLNFYRAASERGLAAAILGNPASRKRIEEILKIARPVYFQVSLEGLRDHNDSIRGRGSFNRAIEFLKLLRKLKVPSKVMLTLTEANLEQVLPLGEMLRDLTDSFTFNRLSSVGEGVNLKTPSRANFARFLQAYMEASRTNRTMGWKDNLINAMCYQRSLKPFGGCTGYGCGAAFNFISVLSDGEAHACRKFPSPIGSVYRQSLAEIYDSVESERYRSGPEACRSCPIRIVCRGCLAVAFSHGLDVFRDRDPYCFLNVS